MILKALVERAESLGLTGDLDYQPMPVRWLLTIGPEGQLLGEMADTQRRRRAARESRRQSCAASPTVQSGLCRTRRNSSSTSRNMCSGGSTRRR